jgi:replicative DNA helicase
VDGLTYRAERALLGAMIADPSLAARLSARYLERGDFSDSQNRSLYALIHALSVAGTMTGSAWREAIVLAGGPHVSEQYLDDLVAACPDPSHGAAYGALVVQARVHREVAGHAAHLARQAMLLHHDTRRLTEAVGGEVSQTAAFARHLTAVADALREHAASGLRDAPLAPGAHPGSGVEQDRLEERVLAALIQQHHESGQILQRLPARAFTDPLRRRIFLAVRGLWSSGRPVDELILDWELAGEHTRVGLRAAGVPAAYRASDSYPTHLAHASIGDDPPLKLADALLVRLHRVGRGRQPLELSSPGPGQDLTLKPPGLAISDHRHEQRM